MNYSVDWDGPGERDREVCECPRCGRSHWELGKPPGQNVPVTGIHLRKEGKYTIVAAEIGGVWVEVIRELSDGNFSHIVEPDGMFSAYYAMPALTKGT